MFKKENFADVLAQSMNEILESEGHKAIFEPPKVKTAMKKTASAGNALEASIRNLFKVAKILDKMGLKKSAQEVSGLATEISEDIGTSTMTPAQEAEAAAQAMASSEADIVVKE